MKTNFVSDLTSSDLLRENVILQDICSRIDTPRSLAVLIALRYNDYAAYLSLDWDPNHYLVNVTDRIETIQNVKNDYLVTKFLSKSISLVGTFKSDDEMKKEVVDDFLSSEEVCGNTNSRILLSKDSDELTSVLFYLKTLVIEILDGDLSLDDLHDIEASFGPGSGSTLSVTGEFTSDSKYCERPHITDKLMPFAKSICGPLWGQYVKPKCVDFNRFTSVEKNAKVRRGICIEPDLNVQVQRGIGQVLKRKLAGCGNSIKFQTRNQLAAKRAYSDGLSTLDLSKASDTVSYLLVYSLFPPRWFNLLDTVRCQKTKLPGGKLVTLNKFSSMGNGFTFELETIIFLAICRLCVPKEQWKDICVYGDDIVVPRAYANEVSRILALCGFSLNHSKSYLAGNFFESCGCDYFLGHNISPIYSRGRKNHIDPFMQLANKIRLYSKMGNGYCDSKWQSTWQLVLSYVPANIMRYRVPELLGDVGVIDSYDHITFGRRNMYAPALTSTTFDKIKDGKYSAGDLQLEGHFVEHIKFKHVTRNRNDRFELLLFSLAHCGNPDNPFTGGLMPVRNQFGSMVKTYSFVQRYRCDLKWC